MWFPNDTITPLELPKSRNSVHPTSGKKHIFAEKNAMPFNHLTCFKHVTDNRTIFLQADWVSADDVTGFWPIVDRRQGRNRWFGGAANTVLIYLDKVAVVTDLTHKI